VSHEEVHAVRLGRNRVVHRRPDHGRARHGQLKAARASRLCPDQAGDRQGRLLAQVVQLGEGLVRHLALLHHGLAQPGPVADHQERHLAAGPPVVEPARQGHFLTHVVLQVRDRRSLGHESYLKSVSHRSKTGRDRRSYPAPDYTPAQTIREGPTPGKRWIGPERLPMIRP